MRQFSSGDSFPVLRRGGENAHLGYGLPTPDPCVWFGVVLSLPREMVSTRLMLGSLLASGGVGNAWGARRRRRETEFVTVSDEPAPTKYCDPVIEAYKKDVDRTLLRENLKLTVEERFLKFEQFWKYAQELREAGRRARLTE